jgi:hypothetical protein
MRGQHGARSDNQPERSRFGFICCSELAALRPACLEEETMWRIFTWVLCAALVESMFCADTLAIGKDPAPKKVAHIGALMDKLGSGKEALIAVRLRDKRTVAGYVQEAGPESVSITDPNTGETTIVRYEQVTRLAEVNLATGAQVQDGGGMKAKLTSALRFVVPGRRVQSNSFTGTTLLIIGIVIGILIAVVVAKAV